MYGGDEQKFASLRLLFTYHTTYPGKKLNFMGNEFGQPRAWDPRVSLDWATLAQERHRQLRDAVRDLGALYEREVALHADDSDHTGFRWLYPDDAEHSVISYMRSAGEAFAVVLLNFSPVNFEEYRVGLPRAGDYEILFDSDAGGYGGSGYTLLQDGCTDVPCMGLSHSVSVRLPALTGVVISLR
jgi:1,4-alpha-glucan branching enzyme